MSPTEKRKHDWNNLRDYLSVHDSVLKKYDSQILNQPVYREERSTPQFLELTVEIRFQHKNLKLEIEKTAWVKKIGPQEVAKTHSYSYNVADSLGTFFRYCSPHHHRRYHHKHLHDSVTRKELKRSPVKIGEDDYPHVHEVIDELLKL